MPQGLSIRAYARRRGVSHTAVQKAIRGGRITRLADGSIDPAMADQQWAANTDETKPRNSLSGDPRRRRDPGGPSQPAGPAGKAGNGADGSGYTRARGVRENYTAGLARLDYLERIASLVRSDEVQRGFFTLVRMLRDRLQGIPDRLDAKVAVVSEQSQCHEILRVEVEAILDELQTALVREETLARIRREQQPAAEPASRFAT